MYVIYIVCDENGDFLEAKHFCWGSSFLSSLQRVKFSTTSEELPLSSMPSGCTESDVLVEEVRKIRETIRQHKWDMCYGKRGNER